MPPLNKPLPQATLRELLEAVQDVEIRDAAQVLGAVAKDFGLPIVFTAAPGADVSDRASRLVGIVQARDAAEDATRNGNGFAAVALAAANAGNTTNLQLFNPAGSGKVLVVTRVMASWGGATELWLNHHTAALLNNLALTNIHNRFSETTAPVALTKWQHNAVVLGGSTWNRQLVLASEPVELLQAPRKLPENRGIIVAGTVVNLAGYAYFEWSEEPA